MQDVNDAELRESYRPNSSRGENDGSSLGHGGGVSGFVVKGGPWEQRAPDTASTSEFPSFAGGGEAPQSVPSSGAWGPRRWGCALCFMFTSSQEWVAGFLLI